MAPFLGTCCNTRSKRFLKPQLTSHQYWGLELRTSRTGAGDGAKCGTKFADTPHVIFIEVTQPWAGQRRLRCLVGALWPICWCEGHQRK